MDEGVASHNANDVMMFRTQLNSLGKRVVIDNKVVLEAEKARDELHNQIEQIEQRLHPKRPHTDERRVRHVCSCFVLTQSVGARNVHVCVVEDTDPSPVDRISW